MVYEYLNSDNFESINNNIDLPKIDDREFWDNLADDLKKAVITEGEKQKKIPWSVILLSDYRDFYKTGNRINFEDKSFSRRIKLSAMVLAECIQNKGEFIDDILDGLYLIMEESSWCHPAHNSHIRYAKQTNMPDTQQPVIDLFAAETGAVIGTAEYLLRPVFEGINPLITKYVDAKITDRIIKPYLNEHFWWMGDGSKAINWTVWITQNVLLSAFTRSPKAITSENKENILKISAKSTNYFIDSYGEDGCCDEGAQYYSHAGLCLFGILDIMNDLTDNAFKNVFGIDKIKNIATYIRKIHVDNGYYINFADCAAKAGTRCAREFLFGKAVSDPLLCALAADDYRMGNWSVKLLPKENNLWYRFLQLKCHDDIMRFRHGDSTEEQDVFFDSVGMMISRNDKFVLAAKAGNNADSHNHNDVGSVTLYKSGKPLLIDLGVETYTAKTFSDRRYEIWTMQSVYHNLPTFYDGHETIMELAGEKYAAKDVVFDAENHSLTMDIAPAFGNRNVVSYLREVKLDNDKVLINDEYDGGLKGILGFMTYEEPSVLNSENGDVCVQIGNLAKLYIKGTRLKSSDVSVEICEIKDERLKTTWEHNCYRIRIPFERGKMSVEIV
ncbi:MAG: heparinase II/III-family protein [Butyrivibrio sp.]|nr:heparinase II/III-family protein [Butyrivibrio sp.]